MAPVLIALLLGLCAPGRTAPTSSHKKTGKEGSRASGKAVASAPASVKICFSADPPPFSPEWEEAPTSATATFLDPVQDKDEIVRARRLVQEELTRYSTALVNRNLDYVYIVKSLSEEDTEVGGLNSPEDKKLYLEDTGVYDEPMERYVRSSIHHELAHVLLANYADQFSRTGWSRLNTPGFRYGVGGLESIKEEPEVEVELDPESWEEGFAYPYGKSDIDEDVACLAEALFSGNTRFWKAVDRVPVLNRKVKALIAFYHALDNTLTEAYFRQITPFLSVTDPVIAARYAAELDEDGPKPLPGDSARTLAVVLLALFLIGGGGVTLFLILFLRRNNRQLSNAPSGSPPWLTAHLRHLVVQNDLIGLEDALKRGADPNSCDANGTPLLVAALLGGNPRTAEVLLEHGANPDLAAPDGTTARLAAQRHLAVTIDPTRSAALHRVLEKLPGQSEP